MAQEFLTTFADELNDVALQPGGSGRFEIRLDGEIVFSRTEEKRFPEIKELKQRIRDRVAPARDLGHTDS